VKVASHLLCSVLASGLLGGCGEAERAAAPTPAKDPETALAQAFDAVYLDEVFRGDLDGMEERRTLRALVVPSRTAYFLDGGTQRGVTYEALRRFERELNRGRSAGEKIHVIIAPVTRDALIPALRAGLGDLAAANLTITPERLAEVDFSTPLLEGVREIVVSGPDARPLASLDDLAGREVWVRASTSQHASLRALNERLAARGLAPVAIHLANDHLETEDLLEMLNAGLIELTIADDHLARFWSQIHERITLHPQLAIREGGEIAWMFRKDSPKLKAAVDAFVARHRKGTRYGNILFQRYLKSVRWVANPLEHEHRARFDATAGIFQKHASAYGLDWLMIAAQGYQESRLDQSARSPAGAIGVMQLLPSTAASDAVGIPDIHELEPNVHAGVKYLRWIVDTYFSDDSLDDLDKTLFAFAAYNAGPSRLARLRDEAGAEGLDRNRWFRNVERVVAREIGRETVQYVANIYKYWVAYRLALAQETRRDQARRRPGPGLRP
jgi:membrane-bound lytic murein transglycosylase MltF